jgi:general secretion pathway protein D
MEKKTVFILFLFFSFLLFAQTTERQLRGYNNPDELISLSPEISYNQAFGLINEISERSRGIRIVVSADLPDPINILIQNMDYQQAFSILVQMAGLVYEEKDNLLVVRRRTETTVERNKETYAPIDVREIKISAVFFELNVAESKNRGIDWQFLLQRNNLSIGGEIGVSESERSQSGGGGGGTGGQQQADPSFQLGGSSTFNAGGFFGRATAMFRLFESNNLGEIIASPNVTVRDRNQARLQVGSDISIKQRDFAGNVIENFFSTGTILNVTPYVYNEEGLDYLLLNIQVERSSYVPDPSTTIINKTEANTQVVMLDGEETIIGGLFVNTDTKIRTGVPVLKDLPWWVFGLRYIFGSDETVIEKRELVILIKAELVPTLKERLAFPQSKKPIQDEILRQRENIQIHKFNQKDN